MGYSLNSLKELIYGSIIEVTKGEARSFNLPNPKPYTLPQTNMGAERSPFSTDKGLGVYGLGWFRGSLGLGVV